MSIDLKEIFAPFVVSQKAALDAQVLICDVFGTLLDEQDRLIKSVHECLLHAQSQGAEVILASTEHAFAIGKLIQQNCEPSLLVNGVQSKAALYEMMRSSEKSFAVIDDTIHFWGEMAIAVDARTEKARRFFEQRQYLP